MFKTRPEIDDDLVVTDGPMDAAAAPEQGPTSAGLSLARGGPADSAGLADTLSFIGEDMTVTGTLTSKGEIQIEGQIEGDITCSAVTIGDNAKVQGGVLADHVIVHGRLDGAIYGTKVILHSNSLIEGDIHHRLLSIEEGAQFDGQSRRSDDPKALVQAAREARQTGTSADSRALVRSPTGKRSAA